MWGVGCARLRRAGAGERAEQTEAGDSGAERGEGSRERRGQRETASPMVLHCVVGEEVAATLRAFRIRLEGSFLCPLGMIIACFIRPMPPTLLVQPIYMPVKKNV